jgi:predicted component of type VI protein secretion system
MVMTDQHLSDLLYAQWRLLWPLPVSQRKAMIEEIKADYVYEQTLDAVSDAMREPIIGSAELAATFIRELPALVSLVLGLGLVFVCSGLLCGRV